MLKLGDAVLIKEEMLDMFPGAISGQIGRISKIIGEHTEYSHINVTWDNKKINYEYAWSTLRKAEFKDFIRRALTND